MHCHAHRFNDDASPVSAACPRLEPRVSRYQIAEQRQRSRGRREERGFAPYGRRQQCGPVDGSRLRILPSTTGTEGMTVAAQTDEGMRHI